MRGNGWWHLLFAATMAVLAGILTANLVQGAPRDALSLVAVGILVVAYVVVGRHGFTSTRGAVVFLPVMVLCAGVGAAGDPNMAFVQCIAMPLLWTQIRRTRNAVVVNVALVAAIAAGMLVFFGSGAQSIVEVALIEGCSLVGSLCLGIWISRIFELSIERQRLLDELRAAQQQVAVLGREAGAAAERERLARELHDTIAQSITGVVLLAQRAGRELAADSPEAAAETLVLIEETARETLVETRTLVAAGAPVDLDAGLDAALLRLGRRFERETGLHVEVTVPGDGPTAALPKETQVVVLRCAQEALANVRKHSEASTVAIALRRSGADVVLEVRDDGRGFSPDALEDGFGIAGMRSRVAVVGGRLDVETAPGAGVRLTATVAATLASVGAGASSAEVVRS
ncbi:hypothetical protein AX769_05185 [Frondihabitans sp. PAMC 28766]|uniref:sensor histidine kinase n=1 Tax=Frondihabitans sp. PAMC 28766 TaxID=1795630 RepID=UPI00078E13AD|nr:sensor histidine kinase [Frondihabitans sp. PAMC 28766]AMM19645.1 hypothetical protein AX769_05185 [Frondihabitans sp. PAMC 28766]